MLFWIFLIILSLQRISELFIAKRNEKLALSRGAREYDKEGYKFIVLMHLLFFLVFIAEFYIFKRTLNPLWPLLLTALILTEVLRYWAIFSLGTYWNTKILVIPDITLVTKGPYKYLNHPNYLAVVLEILVVPLIFSCYITSILFTALNFFVLRRRIRIEEKALNENAV